MQNNTMKKEKNDDVWEEIADSQLEERFKDKPLMSAFKKMLICNVLLVVILTIAYMILWNQQL